MNILGMTTSRIIGILILLALIMLIVFVKNRNALKGYGVLAPVLAYILFTGVPFSVILLVWWAISMIITG